MAESVQASWCIGKVANIDDPDKRRRIQVRCPHDDAEQVPDDKLPWLIPIQFNQDYFELPDKDASILVIQIGDAKFWVELPNKAAWQDFGDDYATAWMFNHRDVLLAAYKESIGFEFKLVGNIKFETNKTTLTIKDDSVKFEFDKFSIESDGTSATIKVNNVEIKTDGTTFNVKNGTTDLAAVIDDIYDKLSTHTHTSAAGPTGPAIEAPQVQEKKTTASQLLK